MNILYILVPVALMLAGAGALAFRWAVNDGQFDDLESPAFRILIDDEQHLTNTTSDTKDSDTSRRA